MTRLASRYGFRYCTIVHDIVPILFPYLLVPPTLSSLIREVRVLYRVAETRYSHDQGTKPPGYYSRYDEVFAAKRFTPTTILEVGVHMGESTKTLSIAYPDAKIVGIDINKNDLDFSDFPNISYLQADQSNYRQLTSIVWQYFPNGIDLVIDDASHVGALSKATFDIVFPHVRSGGLYIVEDWGTGYWSSRGGMPGDGGRYQKPSIDGSDINRPTRIKSHDYGMVGFVKSLVDLTSEPDIRENETAPVSRQSRIRTLEFSAGICIAEKG